MEEFQKVQFWQVDADCDGQRIDNYLFSRLKGVPKSRIYRLLRKGELRINKKRCKAETRLSAGDSIRVPPIRVSTKTENPQIKHFNQVSDLENQILFESKSTILLNKPSGMAVHGGSGLSYGVIEGLRAIRPDHRFLELVHRLDKNTSGCLLIAKKRSALRFYQDQLRQKQMQKEYLAICQGQMKKKKQLVNAPLLKLLLKSGERVVKVDSTGKKSATRFEEIMTAGEVSLVRAFPLTGRTHQIRVHALHLGMPLIGDEKYNSKIMSDSLVKALGRNNHSFYLHARRLSFLSADDGNKTTFSAPLPKNYEILIDKLGLSGHDL